MKLCRETNAGASRRSLLRGQVLMNLVVNARERCLMAASSPLPPPIVITRQNYADTVEMEGRGGKWGDPAGVIPGEFVNVTSV